MSFDVSRNLNSFVIEIMRKNSAMICFYLSAIGTVSKAAFLVKGVSRARAHVYAVCLWKTWNRFFVFVVLFHCVVGYFPRVLTKSLQADNNPELQTNIAKLLYDWKLNKAFCWTDLEREGIQICTSIHIHTCTYIKYREMHKFDNYWQVTCYS